MREIFVLFRKHLKYLSVFFLIYLVVVTWGVFQLPVIYRSTAVLFPTADQVSSDFSGSLGGLAGLAGVDLGGDVSKAEYAVSILESRKFLIDFIRRHRLEVFLMAANSWDGVDVIIDNEIYDSVTSKWVRQDYRITPVPTDLELYDEFIKIFHVSKDGKSNLYRIHVDHVSPELARSWVEFLVFDINRAVRSEDINAADEKIRYLEKYLLDTNVVEMQQAFYKLIEEQVKLKMLAETKPDYVFKVIDPPFLPEIKHSPKRGVLLVFFLIIGVMANAFYLWMVWVFRDYSLRDK